MSGDSTTITNPPPVDPTAGMAITAAASVDKMAMFVGGQVMQTQMMTNMMNLQGMRDMMLQQDKLDAKLEIASLNYEARMNESEMGHKERMTELANDHVEALALNNEIDLDSDNYAYPYQWGTT
jgi:hypothetical protein